jgi:hypothetical protein
MCFAAKPPNPKCLSQLNFYILPSHYTVLTEASIGATSA